MTGRTSLWFPREPAVWLHSTEAHLLLEDFNLHVVPHRNRRDAYELSVQGISNRLVNKALSLWNDGDGADSFVSAVASTLLTERESWLEVILNTENRDGLPFRPLLVNGVRRAATGKIVQEVPISESATDPYVGDSAQKFQTIELDDARMVHVQLPAKYPNRVLKKIVDDLVEIDATYKLMPPWILEQMTGQRSNVPAFDPGEAARTRRLRILQATLPIGWAAREVYYGESRHLGDYYYFWRELRFLHFRSSMRERAEKALQQVLTVAGDRCGFEAHVTARGLYTPAEVEEIIKKYESGDLPLSTVTGIIFEESNNGQHSERVIF